MLSADLFLTACLIPFEVTLELLGLVRQDEFVWQMVLVKVVDQVPESFLIILESAQVNQINFKVLLAQHLRDIMEQVLRTHEIRLKLLKPFIWIA